MAGEAQARGDELLTEVKDFLDRLGQAIALSQSGGAARMRS